MRKPGIIYAGSRSQQDALNLFGTVDYSTIKRIEPAIITSFLFAFAL